MFGAASYVLSTAAGLVYGPSLPPQTSNLNSTVSSKSSSNTHKKSRSKKSNRSTSHHHHRPSTSNLKPSLQPDPRPTSVPPPFSRNTFSSSYPTSHSHPSSAHPPHPPPPINSNRHSSTSSRSSSQSKLRPNGERGVAYDLVDQINRDRDLYHVLGFKQHSFYNRHLIIFEDIRKAYITRSRLCHPDKLPLYPSCTPAFQKLSFAYETLSKPQSRRLYDLSGQSGHQFAFDHSNQNSTSEFDGAGSFERFRAYRASNHSRPDGGPSGDETLNSVLHSTFCEFMDGDFEMIRVLINALNEGNPGLNLGEEAINNLETTFKKLRSVLLTGQKYVQVIRFELIKLYEIQSNLRSLSYFNLLGRLRLTLALARITLTIPMRIDQVMQEKDPQDGEASEEDEETEEAEEAGPSSRAGRRKRSGLLPRGVAGLLEATVAVLERGEKATMWVSAQTGGESNDETNPEEPAPATSSKSSTPQGPPSTSSSSASPTPVSPDQTTTSSEAPRMKSNSDPHAS